MSSLCARTALSLVLRLQTPIPRPPIPIPPRATLSPSRLTPHHHRQFHQTPLRRAPGVPNPRNDKIPYEIVQLVNPLTKKLDPPQPLAPLLEAVLKTSNNQHYLELVSAPSPAPKFRPQTSDGNGEGEEGEGEKVRQGVKYAIVRLVNKREAVAKEKEFRKREREVKKQNDSMEIQVGWNMASQDVEHKMKKVREGIERGMRVELVLATRQGKEASVSPEEMGRKTREMVSMVEDVAREWRPRNMNRRVTVVYLQSKQRALPTKSVFHNAAAVEANSTLR